MDAGQVPGSAHHSAGSIDHQRDLRRRSTVPEVKDVRYVWFWKYLLCLPYAAFDFAINLMFGKAD
jgi:hypothetical protein